jgi:hypothetical protein
LIAQHVCRHCGHDLRIAARVRGLAATRCKAQVIDDLCRVEAARRFAARSSLIYLRHAISPGVAHALTQLSVAARMAASIASRPRLDSAAP